MPGPADQPLLEVRDLTVEIRTRAGSFLPVNGHSFDLWPREIVGIVGESGSGKSMTAMSLMRLLPKHAAKIRGGSIRLAGQDLLALTEKQMRKLRGRDISMILQDPQTSLNPAFTAGNQITEALRLHPTGSRKSLRQQAIDILRRVRVAAPEHRIDAYPSELSGGMRQRVVGAIAISCNPKLIIADEPTTALDVTVQAQYLRLLKELQAETGMAVLFITHDFGIVASLCDRILVMYAGQIVESGPVAAIFDRPAHPYTEALIAAVPKLRGHQGRLRTIPGQPPAPGASIRGCPFAPRCDHADSRCRQQAPPNVAIKGPLDRSARCWRVAR